VGFLREHMRKESNFGRFKTHRPSQFFSLLRRQLSSKVGRVRQMQRKKRFLYGNGAARRRVFISHCNVYWLVTFRKHASSLLLACLPDSPGSQTGVLLGIVLSPLEHTAIAQKQSKRYLSISHPTRHTNIIHRRERQ
jgi:hypothetical protein